VLLASFNVCNLFNCQDGGVVTICMDANFGLVRKFNSGTSPRPLLVTDSFFLDNAEVNNFVNNYTNDKQKDQACAVSFNNINVLLTQVKFCE